MKNILMIILVLTFLLGSTCWADESLIPIKELLDQRGLKYEQIEKRQIGERDVFNPVNQSRKSKIVYELWIPEKIIPEKIIPEKIIPAKPLKYLKHPNEGKQVYVVVKKEIKLVEQKPKEETYTVEYLVKEQEIKVSDTQFQYLIHK